MARRPSLTPLLSAMRRLCWAKVSPALFAMMYFLIAADDDPPRSLRALIAAVAIEI
jgi:hypothetical protein